MPRTTVYIRNEDWDKWKLIENKSELLSQAINRSVISPVVKKNGKVKTKQYIEAWNESAKNHPGVPQLDSEEFKDNKDIDFCKHDQVKGFCKKGCK